MIEVAVLLSLMIGSSAEDFQMYKIDWNRTEEIQLKSDVLLDNVRSVVKQIKVRAFFFCAVLLVFSCHEKLFSSSFKILVPAFTFAFM